MKLLEFTITVIFCLFELSSIAFLEICMAFCFSLCFIFNSLYLRIFWLRYSSMLLRGKKASYVACSLGSSIFFYSLSL